MTSSIGAPVSKQVTAQQRSDVPSQAYIAKLEFTPSRAQVGTRVGVKGSSYPPGATVELVWYTVDASYEFERGTEYLGHRIDEASWVLATVEADSNGDISTTIEIPTDFGGSHDVRGRVDGREVSQAALTIDPTMTLTPTEGPVGTPLELRIAGVDWRPSLSTWHLLYDNKYLGFMSAVTTRGVATARFRAAGPVGPHIIGVWRNGYNNSPYLAIETSPFRDTRGPGTEMTFLATDDAGAPPPFLDDFSSSDDPWPTLFSGPGALSVYPDRGIAGQSFSLQGLRLPPQREVSVRWWTTVGDRITSVGMVEEARLRRTVTTDDRGSFVIDMEFPDDLGGQHKIDVVADGSVLGSTGVVVIPKLFEFGPRRARVGERILIHLKGLGWTTYDNTYTVTYDNAFIGYVCGFSSGGDVKFHLTATGGPGTHLIDLYPTIYKAKDPGRMPRGCFSVPQLTYADDHPGRRTPAVRLAIEIGG
jgi:hypothetical protein